MDERRRTKIINLLKNQNPKTETIQELNARQLSELKTGIGEILRAERFAQGLSLRQLGRKSMIKPETLDRLEMGHGRFDVYMLLRIANALDMPFSTFLCYG